MYYRIALLAGILYLCAGCEPSTGSIKVAPANVPEKSGAVQKVAPPAVKELPADIIPPKPPKRLEGYRAAKWGMKGGQIIAIEGTPRFIIPRNGAVTYVGNSVAGLPVTTYYQFDDSCYEAIVQNCKFTSGMYVFENASDEAVEAVNAALVEKYGEPDVATVIESVGSLKSSERDSWRGLFDCNNCSDSAIDEKYRKYGSYFKDITEWHFDDGVIRHRRLRAMYASPDRSAGERTAGNKTGHKLFYLGPSALRAEKAKAEAEKKGESIEAL